MFFTRYEKFVKVIWIWRFSGVS